MNLFDMELLYRAKVNLFYYIRMTLRNDNLNKEKKRIFCIDTYTQK